MIKHVHLREQETVRASMRLWVHRGVGHASDWKKGTQHLEVGARVPRNEGHEKKLIIMLKQCFTVSLVRTKQRDCQQSVESGQTC